MRLIGLTGTVAAGKSTVARLFAGWGATIIDADAIVRELQRPRTPVFEAIVRRFGPQVVGPAGHLDRGALRDIVMANPDDRTDLEGIVHPAVERRRVELIERARVRGDAVVVADIPLLLETMDPATFDGIVVVDAPVALRHERLQRDRALSQEAADALMAAQWSPERKRERADWIIDNDGSRGELEQRARVVWNAISS